MTRSPHIPSYEVSRVPTSSEAKPQTRSYNNCFGFRRGNRFPCSQFGIPLHTDKHSHAGICLRALTKSYLSTGPQVPRYPLPRPPLSSFLSPPPTPIDLPLPAPESPHDRRIIWYSFRAVAGIISESKYSNVSPIQKKCSPLPDVLSSSKTCCRRFHE